jgi:siroheme synthase-like protein
MSLFPIFLKLEGRACLVVGAGRVAETKIDSLLAAGAAIRVVAPRAEALVRGWAERGSIAWAERDFVDSDLDGAALVIAATSSNQVNQRVFRAAQERKVWCNAVDDPPNCDFFYGAVVRRGDLQIAISTAGQSPALAQRLRAMLESQFPPQYAAWVDQLGKARARLFSSAIEPEERRRRLHRMVSHPVAAFSHLAQPKERRNP